MDNETVAEKETKILIMYQASQTALLIPSVNRLNHLIQMSKVGNFSCASQHQKLNGCNKKPNKIC
jgi:hypothetical protein